jgi:hypothetical protein
MNYISTEETRGLLIELVRLLYVLNKIDLALELFNDDSFKVYLRGTYANFLIMNKLLIDGRLQEVIDLFFSQVDYFSIEKSYSLESDQSFRQAMPFDQLDSVVEALYIQVKLKFNQMIILFNRFIKI